MRDQLKCGDCGGSTFRLFFKGARGAGRFGGGGQERGTLIVRCLACGDETKVKPETPGLATEGNLCGGWGKKG